MLGLLLICWIIIFVCIKDMFTMSNAETGINSSEITVKIDLSNYALTSETATKVDLEAYQNNICKHIG